MAENSRRTALRVLPAVAAALLVFVLGPETAGAALTIEQPAAAARTNGTPTFAGSTTDALDRVLVKLWQGGTAEGSPGREMEAAPSNGGWRVAVPTPLSLASGEWTAVAEQQELELVEGLGGTQATPPLSFTVYTGPPTVTIVGPPARASNRSPSFSGTASEDTEVTVHVLEGGTTVATASTSASGGHWALTLPSPLAEGTHDYTAFATEKSGLGNEEGQSAHVGFEVDTRSPQVTIQGPPGRSNDTTPSFSGTAGEPTEVAVHVFEGSTEVASAKTTAVGGNWSAMLATPLPSGRRSYTAYATERSGIGNPPGVTPPVSFVVDTEPPTVTIEQPPPRGSDRTPSFAGTAGEATEVVVHVLEEGREVGKAATTASSGRWSATLATPLPSGRHRLSAYATERSGIGNGDGTSGTVGFELDTESPSVTLTGPPARSRDTAPTFAGTASEDTEVVVHVLHGASEVAHVATTASGGLWSTPDLGPALPAGRSSYTAYATERSGIGNEEGRSATVAFEVDTEPPTVTLTGPPARSNDRTPSFSGSAGEETEVVVHLLEGAIEVGRAGTTASGGKWSVSLSPALPAGEHAYTAYATETSAIGNEDGRSATVGFELDTEPPRVTIQAPPPRSKDTTPSFSGTASEAGHVEIHVLSGESVLATATATVSAGKWATAPLATPLPEGRHSFKVYATEPSAIGNAPGQSLQAGFEVDTEPPSVTIVGPPARGRTRSPSFSGAASENTEVTVHVFEGATPVETASTSAAGGQWSLTLPSALAEGEHQYTAYATEKSALENKDGHSSTVTFSVDTNPPSVTLSGPPARSNNTTPSFAGTASEETEVVVHVLEGASEVGVARTSAAGGKWAVTLSPALLSGEHAYTAYATERSGIGNADGRSATVAFEVDTEPPHVTLDPPAQVSSVQTPSFSGTASEAETVSVQIYRGASAAGTPVETLTAKPKEGRWTTAHVRSPLEDGGYTVLATEPSSLGNRPGSSPPASFEVDTSAPPVTVVPPPSPTNVTAPSFSGTVGSSASEVSVVLYEGTNAGGRIVAQLKASVSGGTWKAGPVAPPLPGGRHAFTVVASAPSRIPGNGTGQSVPEPFVINTEPPLVTLEQPRSPTNEAATTFRGKASETSPVTVEVFAGSQPTATPVAIAKATGTGGAWATALASRLPDGVYSAVARQPSEIGNGPGVSAPVTYTIDTASPSVSLDALPTPSANRAPFFSGSATDSEPVQISVYEGSCPSGCDADVPVATATGEDSEGRFVSERVEQLEWGEYTAIARQASSIGNPTGQSALMHFAVEKIPPAVLSEASSDIGRSFAAMYASVNPLGSPIGSCYFEYGPSSAYGKSVECGFVETSLSAFPPTAVGFVPVFARVYGLTPGTTYHFRIVAAGEGGTAAGADGTFTTLPPLLFEEPPPPPPRRLPRTRAPKASRRRSRRS